MDPISSIFSEIINEKLKQRQKTLEDIANIYLHPIPDIDSVPSTTEVDIEKLKLIDENDRLSDATQQQADEIINLKHTNSKLRKALIIVSIYAGICVLGRIFNL